MGPVEPPAAAPPAGEPKKKKKKKKKRGKREAPVVTLSELGKKGKKAGYPIELHASSVHTLANGAPLPKPYINKDGVEMVPVMLSGKKALPRGRTAPVAAPKTAKKASSSSSS